MKKEEKEKQRKKYQTFQISSQNSPVWNTMWHSKYYRKMVKYKTENKSIFSKWWVTSFILMVDQIHKHQNNMQRAMDVRTKVIAMENI